MGRVKRFLAATAVLTSIVAAAGERPWQVINPGPIVVKVRDRDDGGKEFWAEGDLKAEVIDVQTVLMDTAGFTKFLPYMTESRDLPERDKDGAFYTYHRLDLPVVSPRDYIHKVYITKRADQAWTKGVYAAQWHAMPYKLPIKDGVVRLMVSEGSWLVSPAGPGKAHAVYKFSADPGGSIPGFLRNRSDPKEALETFASIERQAGLRVPARLAAEAKARAADAGAP